MTLRDEFHVDVREIVRPRDLEKRSQPSPILAGMPRRLDHQLVARSRQSRSEPSFRRHASLLLDEIQRPGLRRVDPEQPEALSDGQVESKLDVGVNRVAVDHSDVFQFVGVGFHFLVLGFLTSDFALISFVLIVGGLGGKGLV